LEIVRKQIVPRENLEMSDRLCWARFLRNAPSLSPEASGSASATRGSPTPAEFAPFRGVVDGILAPTKTISSLKQVLVGAATKAELNPQPLILRV